jgi:hypothetical protein
LGGKPGRCLLRPWVCIDPRSRYRAVIARMGILPSTAVCNPLGISQALTDGANTAAKTDVGLEAD